jgi:hypothetical protein
LASEVYRRAEQASTNRTGSIRQPGSDDPVYETPSFQLDSGGFGDVDTGDTPQRRRRSAWGIPQRPLAGNESPNRRLDRIRQPIPPRDNPSQPRVDTRPGITARVGLRVVCEPIRGFPREFPRCFESLIAQFADSVISEDARVFQGLLESRLFAFLSMKSTTG